MFESQLGCLGSQMAESLLEIFKKDIDGKQDQRASYYDQWLSTLSRAVSWIARM
jgi:hypothetical protein